MTTPAFGREDVGCYADSLFGHAHLREMLALLLFNNLENFAPTDRGSAKRVLLELQLDEPSDDLSEERDAVDLLNELVEPGVLFEFVDGDLVLLETEEV